MPILSGFRSPCYVVRPFTEDEMGTQRWKSLVQDHSACRSRLRPRSGLSAKSFFCGTAWKLLTWLGRVPILNTENIVSWVANRIKWKKYSINSKEKSTLIELFSVGKISKSETSWVTDVFWAPPCPETTISPLVVIHWEWSEMSRWSPILPIWVIMSSQSWRTTTVFPFMIWASATDSPCLYPESLSSRWISWNRVSKDSVTNWGEKKLWEKQKVYSASV